LPIFTSKVADLFAAGPGIQISVGPSRELIHVFRGLGARVPSPHLVSALIDTGAHSTVLNPEVISHLGIRPVGVAAIVTPSTTAALTCNRYHINVHFSEHFVIENVFAIEAPMGGVPYQCLIGRDILRLATLIYAGQRNEFTLDF
jgi:predicted aspartyl protease